ncbi:MAG: DNA repair protein RecO [Solirubrobacterales bacterium]
MSEWIDEGIVLAVRRHGESNAIVSLLTREHGRHPGLVHGGAGRASRGILQPGNQVKATWRARLAEQLGSLKVELVRDHAGAVMDDADKLAALASACALSEAVLPERQPHRAVHEALLALLDAFAAESWPTVYVHWEMALLRALGYGLDLTCCAATGSNDGLAYVSPRSGRAVSLSAGQPYRDKLLALPRFLVEGGEGDTQQILDGLRLTAFFLDRHVLAPHNRLMPAARSRLVDRLLP